MTERIMLVIHGRIFRQSIEHFLRRPNRVIVGDCETLDQVEAQLRAHPDPRLDLVLVALGAPDQAEREFSIIRSLRAAYPATRWVVLGRTGGKEFFQMAAEARIDGLVHADSPAEVLQQLVDLVLIGYCFVPTELASVITNRVLVPPVSVTTPAGQNGQVMLSALRRTAGPPGEVEHHWQSSLSDRESDILRGLVAGHSNKLIARELSISEATVKVHVKALLRKMRVTNRTQAAISALHWLRSPQTQSASDDVIESANGDVNTRATNPRF